MMNEFSRPESCRYVSLFLAGTTYQYLYNTSNQEVYTEYFPGIKIHKLQLPCGTTITHDQVSQLIQDKIEFTDRLAQTFSSSEADEY